jgi:hypothetical protein
MRTQLVLITAGFPFGTGGNPIEAFSRINRGELF